MKILISFIFLMYVCAASACVLTHKVISLSGSMTVLLKNIGLLNDPNLAGISVFNPVTEKEFKGKVFPGGLFIAQSTLHDFSKSVVFYDKGEQIKRILSSREDITGIEISTRERLPLEVVDLTLKKLAPYSKGCEEKMQNFRKASEDLQQKLLSKIPKDLFAVFYLGEIRNSRAPELVMANDGAVKLLVDQKKLKSYPSKLSYVNWSAKVISGLPSNILHVGISDPGMKYRKEIKRSSNRMTLYYPGALVPGYSQLEAFLYWAESL